MISISSTLRLAALVTCTGLLVAACRQEEETIIQANIQQSPPEVFEDPKEPEEPEMSETNAPTEPALLALHTFAQGKNIDTSNSKWRTSLPKPPLAEFNATSTYYWNLETSEGMVKVKLLPNEAPMHVSSTIYLTQLGFYDGLIFHRIIPGFMAQGGCPDGRGSGSPGYSYDGEFASERHDGPGVLSMANRGPGTDGSQFFLTFVPTPHLDGKHTIFGRVTDGLEVLTALEGFGSGSGQTSKECKIVNATITVE